MTERDAFGPRLKREREQRGIALKTIADATKIKESLFADLERSDFSNWPEGIFRRAHICAYASAIGLAPQAILADYQRLFPDADAAAQPEALSRTPAPDARQPAPSPRPVGPASSLPDRVWVVSFDAAAICLISSILAAVTRLSLLPVMALAGLAYSAVGSACFGQSVGSHIQQRIRRATAGHRQGLAVASAPRPQPQPIIFKQPRLSPAQTASKLEIEVAERRVS